MSDNVTTLEGLLGVLEEQALGKQAPGANSNLKVSTAFFSKRRPDFGQTSGQTPWSALGKRAPAGSGP